MKLNNKDFPIDLPVVIEDKLFLYPFMISPLFLHDETDINSVDYALKNNSLIAILISDEENDGERNISSCYDVGVVGSIIRKVELPDGRVKILFQGITKIKLHHIIDESKLIANFEILNSIEMDFNEIFALLTIIRDKVKTLSRMTGNIPPDLLKVIQENSNPDRTIDLIASSMRLTVKQSYELFRIESLEDRMLLLIEFVVKEIETLKLQREIKLKVDSKIDGINKEYFLKEQLKQIKKELGIDKKKEPISEEYEELNKKFEKLKISIPIEAKKEITKQLKKFKKMHPDSTEANMLQSYLDSVLDIPYGKVSSNPPNISEVKRQLDNDHYSLKNAKERITEYFAVKKLISLRGLKEKENQGVILCFIGPPGVGKTSLANSIATALKRQLVRVALGGIEDVNELRGHRRTYIGAMVGRIVQGLIEAKEMDPVIVLDEIDKVGHSHRGDPTAVLLEILDPEQNNNFRDLFLNFHIDLSKVIFIATANDIAQIPIPLRDRMEFININSYTPNEKFQIAHKYLIPQEIKKHGLKRAEINISKGALEKMISNYTREAGVRNLRREIAKIVRKVAYEILQNGANKISITLKNISKFLEKEIFEAEEKERESLIGVVNGLAWTRVGGDVLKVEVIKLKGKGAMIITGSLGEVMKESAKIAHSVVKMKMEDRKIGNREIYDLHIHVPEGATPKDGPSAGITMAVAIYSQLTNKKVKNFVAMTGELTLTGKVLPIGGLKEKLIAAYKSKITTVVIPEKNYQKDLDDIPDEVLDALEIKGVKNIDEVLKIALD